MPTEVSSLLGEVGAPPRLIAHLTLVHEVACRLIDALKKQFPSLCLDRDLVLMGAALHDVGKAVVTSELSGPGPLHEEAGYHLLRERGVDERVALLVRDHAKWSADTSIEGLLVSVADKIWKGKRVEELESLLLKVILSQAGEAGERWNAFIVLDEILETLAADADKRLLIQSQYPVHGGPT